MNLKQGMFEGGYMMGTEERKGMKNDVILLKTYCIPFQTQQADKRTQVLRDEGNEELWNNGGFLCS